MSKEKLFCIRGHLRTVSNLSKSRSCKQCKYLWNKKYHKYNAVYRHKYYLTHRDEAKTRAKVWALAHPDRVKAKAFKHRLKRYGLTAEQYESFLLLQGGLCAICKRVPPRDFDIDHDHLTGVVRGLLCNSCNRALGYLSTPDELEAAKQYLLTSQAIRET